MQVRVSKVNRRGRRNCGGGIAGGAQRAVPYAYAYAYAYARPCPAVRERERERER